MVKISSKRKYYDLAFLGLAGNSPRMWRDISEFIASDYPPDRMVGFRFLNPGSKKFTRVTRETAAGLEVTPGTYIVYEVPVTCSTFQGEFSFIDTYELDYSTSPSTLREAMLDGTSRRATGIAALGLLRYHLGEREAAELLTLLDMYTVQGESPVIEFSRFPEETGIFPGRHTLIWEIRHY